MLLRPCDASGDIMPVLSSSALLSGGEAVSRLVSLRLNLVSGEWWENPARGCAVVEMLRSGRLSARDAASLASYLSSYIAATPGVRSVEDVRTAASGREFSFSCRVRTDAGGESVSFSVSF